MTQTLFYFGFMLSYHMITKQNTLRLQWYGSSMEWSGSGMVWYGRVWYGMVWYGWVLTLVQVWYGRPRPPVPTMK